MAKYFKYVQKFQVEKYLRNKYIFKFYIIIQKISFKKGGFGSLLRAFGKQITRSTDKGACRDLTGRRIRHVNNEAKLKVKIKFIFKQFFL